MSDESGKELSLHYLPFKGKKDQWEMWSAKFMSKARKKRYLKILTGEVSIHFRDENNKTTEEKLNDEAYNDLITSMEDKIAFNKVNQAKTKMLKNGCVRTAWTNLLNKYKPTSVQTRAELKLKFTQLKLEDWTKDPDEW